MIYNKGIIQGKELTPKSLNYKMPAEWHKKQRTFMEWPERNEIWISGMEEAYVAYSNVANKISEFEPVSMIVSPDYITIAKKMLSSDVSIIEMHHDDSWMRDNGPTFIINDKNELAGIKWNFNAWGNKYKGYEKDNKVAEELLEILNIKMFKPDIIMEGGSFHTDGEGTLITNEECLLNRNRNPSLTKENIENYLKDYLGVEKIIWLKKGLYGDETDGHIDNFAAFVHPSEVIIQSCSDKDDPNHEIYIENLNILRDALDAKGRKFTIHEIEQPEKLIFKRRRLTLSYINYYLVNKGVILPVFGNISKKNDINAQNILQEIYPDRKIITIDGIPIVKGGGNVHCITQQMPE